MTLQRYQYVTTIGVGLAAAIVLGGMSASAAAQTANKLTGEVTAASGTETAESQAQIASIPKPLAGSNDVYVVGVAVLSMRLGGDPRESANQGTAEC